MLVDDDLALLFKKDIYEFERNGFKFNDRNKVFSIGNPSQALLAAGLDDLPIIMTQAVLNKAIGHIKGKQDASHELTIDNLKLLPLCIQNPILVCESFTQPHARVIITAITDKKGDTAIAAIHLNAKIERKAVNLIASIHTRSDRKLIDMIVISGINNGIFYADAVKIKSWLKQVGQLQLLPKLLSQL